ncbi:hypothetical protein LO762_23915 [Actinocorallia sp. API 0066]|uniref:hypothetical protein n=1 Tax=Actinocorallia sp. API 0066 TaxID=2896846 RepID=UPI001E5B7CF3|nr:hypothetical protein [Actinocorallia sp. API 0066]MCD0452216.1 hypothetical protein [Actinocorallia sp. API 0066]
MYVIRLANGRLRVPYSELTENDEIVQTYREIGPEDEDYSSLAAEAVSEEELVRIKERWRRDDEALRTSFEEWKATLPDD